MLIKVILRFHNFRSVFNLISRSLEIVNKELQLTNRKKKALDDLLAAERISQPTYEHLEKGLMETLVGLEVQQRSLADKMAGWADELEEQIRLLELVLADLEIRHVAREMDDEAYEKQNKAIILGLEATKQELGDIHGILSKIVSEVVQTSTAPAAPEVIEEPDEKAEETMEDMSTLEPLEKVQELGEEIVESEAPPMHL